MKATLFKMVGVGLLLVVLAGGIVGLKKANASLRERIAGVTRMNGQLNALRHENGQLRELLDRTQKEGANAGEVFRTELANARHELTAAEKTWQENRDRRVAKIAVQVENTDPDRGIARLEHFKNVGRGTPAAALQTVVWAMMKREDVMLASGLSVTGVAREKAEALLARLPPAERVKFPSPESLAVVAVATQILKAEAFAVQEFTSADATYGVLKLRLPEPGRPENTKEAKVPMVLGPGGWQVVVPERAVDEIIRRLSDQLPEPEKK